MQLTIKHILMAITAALAVQIIFLAEQLAVDANEKKEVASLAKQLTPSINFLLEAAGHWAVERGVTNAALKSAAPVTDKMQAIINERRSKGNAAYKNALESLKEIEFGLKESLVNDLQEKFEKAKALRERAQEDIKKPGISRGQEVLKTWVPSMSALIVSSQELRFALGQLFGRADPALSSQALMKHFAWIMSEYAGRERAIIGGVLTSNIPLNEDTLSVLSQYRGNVEQAWRTVKKLNRETTSEDVVLAVLQAERAYFGSFQGVREAIYEAGVGGDDYPVSPQEWIDQSTSAINTLLAIQEASASETDIFVEGMYSNASRQFTYSLLMLGIGILLSGISFVVILIRVVRPINAMTGAMNALAGGDTSIDIPAAGKRDEIGRMATSVQVFKENAIERVRLEEEQKEAEIRAEREKKEAMEHLADSFEQRVQGIIQGVAAESTQLSQTAKGMTDIINQSGQMVQNAASGASETTNNVQSVASAAEQMSATVREISSQIHKSNELVLNSVQTVEGADKHAQALSKASKKVREVTQLISDIAEQINLLALNATIESARAGEAGKGFAVVANEVKSLASQTGQSIQEIEKVIGEMNVASEDIVTSLDAIKTSVNQISESSGGIASAVEEQSATTNEIASNMQSAAQGTQTISDNLQEVSQGAEQSQSASEQVLSAAQELSRQSETLDKEVKAFLSEVRTS